LRFDGKLKRSVDLQKRRAERRRKLRLNGRVRRWRKWRNLRLGNQTVRCFGLHRRPRSYRLILNRIEAVCRGRYRKEMWCGTLVLKRWNEMSVSITRTWPFVRRTMRR